MVNDLFEESEEIMLVTQQIPMKQFANFEVFPDGTFSRTTDRNVKCVNFSVSNF